MTTEATVTIPASPGTPESAAPPTAEQVWERTVGMAPAKPAAAAPITKDDVRGDDPKPEAPSLPDRALVTGQLRDIYSTGQTHSDPIADRLAALEDSLVPRPEPEHPEVYKEIQALRAELAQRDEAAKEAAIAEEREARLRTLREGFVESLRESTDFPAIVAAGFEEKVFNTINAKQLAGEDVSEETILSDTETELWQMYDLLNAVKNPTTSDEPTQSETPQTPTLTPTLTAEDNAATVEDLLQGNDRKAAAAELWARTVG